MITSRLCKQTILFISEFKVGFTVDYDCVPLSTYPSHTYFIFNHMTLQCKALYPKIVSRVQLTLLFVALMKFRSGDED